jgi:predicted phosphodiesterase
VAEYRKSVDQSITYDPSRGVTIPASEIWGDGLAPVVPKTTHESLEVVLFLSDIHVPYHSAPLVKAAVQLAADLQPHQIVFNGDESDFFQLSHFNKAHEREDELQLELDMTADIRKAFCDAAPNAIKRKTLGNHCDRLITWVEINAKSLHSLRAIKPERLMKLDEMEIELYGRAGFRLRPEFVVEHGHVVRKDAGASARSRLNDTLISGIMGHTHRL